MNFQQINEILKKHYGEDVSEFAYDDSVDKQIDGIGIMSEIEQKGGEGEGEEWFSIKHFPDHNVYIKVEGSYYSYDGTNFDDWDDCVKQVHPVEKTITVYE